MPDAKRRLSFKRINWLNPFKEWMDLTGPQQWAVAFPLATTAFTVGVYFLVGVGRLFVASLIITTTGTLLYDRIARYTFENKTSSAMNEFNEKSEDLKHIGTSVDGINWFHQNRSELQSVKNTVFARRHGNAVWSEARMEQMLTDIRKCLDTGCEWRDLAYDTQRDSIDEFWKTLSEKEKRFYSARELEYQYPVLQMLIMTAQPPKHPATAVLFGWSSLETAPSKVFLSTNPNVVSYFERQFDELYRSKGSSHLYGYDFVNPPRPPRRPTNNPTSSPQS